MKRLTFMNGDDCWCVTNDNCFEEQSEHYCGPAIERLAAYEDTGLTPEEIVDRLAKAKLANILEAENKKALDKLMEYRKAEAEGRLVVLPRDGMVYHIEDNGEAKWIGNKPIKDVVLECGWGMATLRWSASSIGKKIFFTHNEAKAALEGGSGESKKDGK